MRLRTRHTSQCPPEPMHQILTVVATVVASLAFCTFVLTLNPPPLFSRSSNQNPFVANRPSSKGMDDLRNRPPMKAEGDTYGLAGGRGGGGAGRKERKEKDGILEKVHFPSPWLSGRLALVDVLNLSSFPFFRNWAYGLFFPRNFKFDISFLLHLECYACCLKFYA